jgi:hypothetical protein
MQTQTWEGAGGSGVVYRNWTHGLRVVARTEGLRGLYRGLGPTMLGSMPASCLYFTTYHVVKSRLVQGEGTPFEEAMVGGMLAELVSCLIWVPVDVVKERMQIQVFDPARASARASASFLAATPTPATAAPQTPSSQSPAPQTLHARSPFYKDGADAVRKILRSEGVAGLYRGYGATVLSFGPYSALNFMMYEQLKAMFEKWLSARPKKQHAAAMPTAVYVLCGSLAGATAALVTNPLDLVKLRLQVQRQGSRAALEGSPERYRHMGDGLLKLWRREGLRGYLRGAGARVAFSAPAAAVNLALFEELNAVAYRLV